MFDWLASKVFGDTLPPDDLIHWYFDTYAWLFKDNGGFEHFSKRPLVLPTDEYFTLFNRGGHDRAEEIFGLVKRYAGMQRVTCRLEARADEDAAGTFSMTWDHSAAKITYHPDHVDDIQMLVATFAHELSHHYHATMAFNAPGGKDAYEPATDLTAVYLGFGIFLANSSFYFKQAGGGWSASNTGYLSELSIAYTLAIFTELQGRHEKEAAKYLRPNPYGYYQGAIRDLRKRWTRRLRDLRETVGND